ncbi:MAG: GNAT family N-acetyltransferase [Bacteroidota bacterium]
MRIHYPPAYTYLWSDNGAWYLKEMYNAKRLAEEFTDSRAKFYRIEDGQQHYGYCKTISGKPPARYGQYANYCYLQRLYLNTNIQGKGIGGWVMNQLLDQAIANGHDAMWLETMEIGKARKFYERLGFSVIDKVRLPFPGMIEELRGLEVMEKSLLA